MAKSQKPAEKTPTSFMKRLKAANSSWKTAKKRASEDRGSSEFDDGRYTSRLVEARLDESGSGRLQAIFGWKFEDGEYEGKIKYDYQGVESEDNQYYLGKNLERLGYELPDDLTDLPEILAAIEKEKPLAQVRLRTKAGSDFQNLYIMKVYGDDEEEAETDEEEEDEAPTDTAEDEEEDTEADADESDEEETDEEAETEDEEEDGTELAVGMAVIAETAKGPEEGVVTEILEKENKVRVRLNKDKKIVRLSPEKITIPTEDEDVDEDTEDEEDEEEAPPVKTKKGAKSTPAPAPAKKKSKK